MKKKAITRTTIAKYYGISPITLNKLLKEHPEIQLSPKIRALTPNQVKQILSFLGTPKPTKNVVPSLDLDLILSCLNTSKEESQEPPQQPKLKPFTAADYAALLKPRVEKAETFLDLDRLIAEEEELGHKIASLSRAINSYGFAEKVGSRQFELLILQQTTMIAYKSVLILRIRDLKRSATTTAVDLAKDFDRPAPLNLPKKD